VINSLALLRSPVKIRGVFPTSLSFRVPPTTGAGGMGMGGPCHGSAGTPLETHAGGEALGLQDARTAIRT
jgi:hypothetical protein